MVNEPSTRENVLEVLAEARKEKKEWFELARIMERGLTPVTDEDPIDVATLARSAGVATVVAKRYLRLLRRMREISTELKEPLFDLLAPSFNGQEMAARIYARSQSEGADALRRLSKGQITIAQLREILVGLEASPNVSLRSQIANARMVGSDTVESALHTDGAHVFGEPFRVRRRAKLRFLGNTGYEVIGRDGSIVAGVDILFPDVRLGHDALDRNVGRSLLLAQFFSKFYIAFPASAEIDEPQTRVGDSTSKHAFDKDMVSRTVELLDWLKYGWVGVLVAVDKTTLKEMKPSVGSPGLDLTDRYESYVRRYATAAADNPFRRKT